MNGDKARRMQGERGASLILVIAFMVVIGAISAAVISTTSSGLLDRVALDQARNREYAADAAIESMIATARGSAGTCPAGTNYPAVNGVSIHVDCKDATAIIGQAGNLVQQDNLVFAACDTGTTCTPATTIINAQVNFRGATPSQTFVQAWSVNR